MAEVTRKTTHSLDFLINKMDPLVGLLVKLREEYPQPEQTKGFQKIFLEAKTHRNHKKMT